MSAPLRETRNELQPLGQLPVDDEWLDDLRLRIDDFCALVAEYLEPEQVEEQRAACRFAAEAHAGVYRKSGEPYIFHPLAVARIPVSYTHLDVYKRQIWSRSVLPRVSNSTSNS